MVLYPGVIYGMCGVDKEETDDSYRVRVHEILGLVTSLVSLACAQNSKSSEPPFTRYLAF